MAGRVYGNAVAFCNKLAQISPCLMHLAPTRPLLQLIDAFRHLSLSQGGSKSSAASSHSVFRYDACAPVVVSSPVDHSSGSLMALVGSS